MITDLPTSVHINGVDTVDSEDMDSVQLVCTSVASFPAPTVQWRVEKVGDITEVDDIEGDVSTEVLEDGSINAVSTLNVTLNTSVKYVRAKCRGIIEELGETRSAFHRIKVIASLTLPRILGVADFSSLPVGHSVPMTCSVGLSEKVEYLAWFVDGEMKEEDHHLYREDDHMVSRWEYVPGMGEREVMCQLNGIKEYSS